MLILTSNTGRLPKSSFWIQYIGLLEFHTGAYFIPKSGHKWTLLLPILDPLLSFLGHLIPTFVRMNEYMCLWFQC